MQNELKIFTSSEFGQIRTIEIDGKPYFVANDAAKALGYANPSDATNTHCKHRILTWGSDSLGRRQQFKVIPEGDLYRLITHSKLESAERFEAWVFDEVLPSIREHGGYIAGQEQMSNEELLSRALLFAQSKIEEKDKLIARQQASIQQMQPKAIFADAVTASETSILVRELAKILKQNGFDTGEKRLYQLLRSQGYLISREGTDYNMPTQKSMELGLFEIQEWAIQCGDNRTIISKGVRVTGKGQLYFINRFAGASCAAKA